MTIKELVFKNRSYRRFHQNEKISIETLKELIDLARLSATGANMQPLKFMLSNEDARNNVIFPALGWAAYLKEWAGPVDGERPSAYIIIFRDTNLKSASVCDYGIAAQSILLGAVEKGFGGCMIATINKQELIKLLNIPAHLEILLVIALGKPKETVVIDSVGPDGDIKYWRDSEGVHHVPKQTLDYLIVK